MTFDELKLLPGSPLQIQLSDSSGQPMRFASRYVGCVPGRSILLAVPRTEGRPARFRSGQKILGRAMIDNGIGAFACVVVSQTSEPYPLLHLSYPKQVSYKSMRGATRVSLNQPITATNISALDEIKVKGKLADISITGARIELDRVLGENGDRIQLTFHVDVAGIARDLAIEAVIRSRVERSTQEREQNLPVVYGIEFIDADEERRLLLYAYVYGHIVHDQLPIS